jgi:hypothetical protein
VSINCVTCHHDIDDAAKVCAYCGSDPRTGEKIIDAQAMLSEVFKPKRTTRAASLLEFARQRQGTVVAAAVVVGFLLLAGLYQFAVRRNDTAIANGSGVPMTEVTDVSDQGDENKPMPMPEMQFQYDGHPQAMRTYIVEPGATPPPAPAPVPPAPPAQPPTKH